MLPWLADPQAWASLGMLLALEIVLGVDNIIFISILVGKLPPEQRQKARRLGLGLAMLARLCLLFSLVWIMRLTEPWFTLFEQAISARDLILIGGGLFLIAKSTHEIHSSLEVHQAAPKTEATYSFMSILVQIAILDIVFSLDSVITAVGLVDHLSIMVIAIIGAVAVMLFAAETIGRFVDENPTIKMLALAFLILIGFTLTAEGLDIHVPKAYIYFAIVFSFAVELLNIRQKNNKTKHLQLSKSIPGHDLFKK